MGCGLVPWASVLCELMRPDPCHVPACDIQKCLQANKYHEGVCFGALQAMERCCSRWKQSSDCCLTFEKTRPGHFTGTVSERKKMHDIP